MVLKSKCKHLKVSLFIILAEEFYNLKPYSKLDGFDSVFSMDSLKSFEPIELQLLMSGDQAPNWTYDEIINFTEPKLGYTKDRLV